MGEKYTIFNEIKEFILRVENEDDFDVYYENLPIRTYLKNLLPKLSEYQKQSDNEKQELIDALIDEVKHSYKDTGSYSEKSMQLIEKHKGKTWEEINEIK